MAKWASTHQNWASYGVGQYKAQKETKLDFIYKWLTMIWALWVPDNTETCWCRTYFSPLLLHYFHNILLSTFAYILLNLLLPHIFFEVHKYYKNFLIKTKNPFFVHDFLHQRNVFLSMKCKHISTSKYLYTTTNLVGCGAQIPHISSSGSHWWGLPGISSRPPLWRVMA